MAISPFAFTASGCSWTAAPFTASSAVSVQESSSVAAPNDGGVRYLQNAFVLRAGGVLTFNDLSLKMQADGNLVLYRGLVPLWATSYFPDFDVGGFQGTTEGLSCAACSASLQADGNLVLYNGSNSSYWASGTNGFSGASLTIESSAPYLAIQSATGSVLWAPIASGFILQAGQAAIVNRLTLSMQPDGNLVLYRDIQAASRKLLWQSSTSGRSCAAGCAMKVQADGNLVLYDGAIAYWNSGTRSG